MYEDRTFPDICDYKTLEWPSEQSAKKVEQQEESEPSLDDELIDR